MRRSFLFLLLIPILAPGQIIKTSGSYSPIVISGGVNGWTGYATITTDASQLSGNVTNYILTVHTTNTHLKTTGNGGDVTSSSGYDINFFSDAGLTTLMTWSVSMWNGSTGEGEYNVMISLTSGSNQTFYLAYGKSSVTTDQSSDATTWSGFQLVNHFKDGTTLDVSDKSGNYTPTNHSATATTGEIDGGILFNGSSYVSLSASTLSNSTFSVSFWAKDAVNLHGSVWGDNGSTPYKNLDIVLYESPDRVYCYAGDGTNFVGSYAGGLTFTGWHHVCVTRNAGATPLIYYDGVSQTVTNSNTYTSNYTPVIIPQGYRPFTSAIDELKVINSVLSADWIKADYVSQKPSQNFLTITF